MSLGTLVFVSPHPAGSDGLPNRPARLLAEFVACGAFRNVVVVNRVHPATFVRHIGRAAPIVRGGLIGTTRTLADGSTLIEHPWPFGSLERRFLRALVGTVAGMSPTAVVVWVADPKSVPAVIDGDESRSWRVAVDAYDAWDRSPLVRGRRRHRAVRAGYRAAAHADIVFANTTAMRDRLRALGAAQAILLPNACPPVDPRPAIVDGRRAGLIYVGRIHERFDVDLAVALAAAVPDTTLTVAGPVERRPRGWDRLAAMPNVRVRGRVPAVEALAMIGAAAALVVLHTVDDYTRSQDVMKAWDALASGTAVISTPIPPATDWPAGLAEIRGDRDGFLMAARQAVDGELESGRAARLEFARANQWSSRAADAIKAIEAVDPAVPPRR